MTPAQRARERVLVTANRMVSRRGWLIDAGSMDLDTFNRRRRDFEGAIADYRALSRKGGRRAK